MLIYHSGSVYSGHHPEDILDNATIMMTYHEIGKKIAKQDKRFKRLRKKRREQRKGTKSC